MPAKTPAAHKISWFVYVGSGADKAKIRKQASMRGFWGYDVECSCGWATHTGGGTRRSLQFEVWYHKFENDCD